jgi:hypothetical protein
MQIKQITILVDGYYTVRLFVGVRVLQHVLPDSFNLVPVGKEHITSKNSQNELRWK